MPFSFASARTKQRGKNWNKSFGTKTKQMSFSFSSAGTKQMGKNWNKSFGTKTKQMLFSFWSARTKQMKQNHLVRKQNILLDKLDTMTMSTGTLLNLLDC